MEARSYIVEGMSCSHCEAAVAAEVSAVEGVASVDVDLDTKIVRVMGQKLDDGSIRAAIDEAGYEAAAT